MPVENPLDLSGRHILVTGASSGIGRETANLLARLGARLAITGRNSERLHQVFGQLSGEGHTAHVFDLNQLDEIAAFVKSIAADLPLDGLVHAAGKQVTNPLRGLTPSGLDDIFRTNISSAAMLARAYSAKGCHNPGGSIVFVASVMAMVGRPAIASYCASKAALTGLTKSLALELVRNQTRVNCIAPGFVETEMLETIREMSTDEDYEALRAAHPLGFGNPRDVANGIAFLLAGTSRWITGTTLLVDGGYTCK